MALAPTNEAIRKENCAKKSLNKGVVFFCQQANLPLFLLVFFLAGNLGANLPLFKTRANLPLFSF
jgi:hypothetical protein